MTPEPISLLVLGANYSPESTGNAPYTTALSRALHRLGVGVRVITTFPHYPEWRIHDGHRGWSSRGKVDEVPVLRLRHFVPRRPTNLRRLLAELSFGGRLALTRWPDAAVVLLVSPSMFSSAVAMARLRASSLLGRRNPGTVVWAQDLYSRGLEETATAPGTVARLVAEVESWLFRRADRVVTIHERFRQVVVDRLRVSPDRTVVIRNWTHLAPAGPIDVPAARARFGWQPDETVVLHAGNQGVKQGLENVVAAARVAAEQGSRVRFVLLGDGSQRRRLEELNGDNTALQFIDPLPDDGFAAALRAADVLLVNELPGMAEMSLPSKLTSYFDAGRPIVAATSDGSATAAELERSGGGVRVDPARPDELVKAAESLAADAEARRSMGESGRRYRHVSLSEDEAVSAMLACLEGVAGRFR